MQDSMATMAFFTESHVTFEITTWHVKVKIKSKLANFGLRLLSLDAHTPSLLLSRNFSFRF